MTLKKQLIEILKEAEQGIGNQDYDKDAEKYADQIIELFKPHDQQLLKRIEEMKIGNDLNKRKRKNILSGGQTSYDLALEDIKKLL